MAQETGIIRVESFPFGSTADGYDSDGYPVYDRAVGAEILRATFEKFFTDGVFPTPGNALQISKGSSLNAVVAPGIFIIKGAMGGYGENGVTLTLDTAAPQGNTAYGIMLRYDQNRNVQDTGVDVGRSLSLRVVRGDAASTPKPPAPDQTTPGVYEYRLGYVIVPSGATDLSGATVTNEKGSAVCPYAAPFEKIDVSSVMDDVREQAGDNLSAFIEFLEKNIDLVESALDETTAGNLQNQINQLKADMLSEENLNPAYLEMADSGVLDKKWLGLTEDSVGSRELKDASVGEANIIDLSVTDNKLSYKIQQLLGLIDPSGWGYTEIYEYLQSINDMTLRDGFVQEYVTSGQLKSWTKQQIKNVNALLDATGQKTILQRVDWASMSLADTVEICKACDSAAMSVMVGVKKSINVGTYGSAVPFTIIGAHHETKTSGGKALFTLECDWIIEKCMWSNSSSKDAVLYQNSNVKAKCEAIYNQIGSADKGSIVAVNRKVATSYDSYVYKLGDMSLDVFILAPVEYDGTSWNMGTGQSGTLYDYYSSNPKGKIDSKVDKTGRAEKSPMYWIFGSYLYNLSEPTNAAWYRYRESSATSSWNNTQVRAQTSYGTEIGICPAFCVG